MAEEHARTLLFTEQLLVTQHSLSADGNVIVHYMKARIRFPTWVFFL